MLKTTCLVSLLTLDLIFSWIVMLSFLVQYAYSYTLPTLPKQTGSNSSKLIILAFDDSPKSQFSLAKTTLDKYGFKASFFILCNLVGKTAKEMNASSIVNFGGKGVEQMSWQDIKTLQVQGHDIESHTMTHTNLDTKSQQNLIYEIGGSKQCLLDHGINSTAMLHE